MLRLTKRCNNFYRQRLVLSSRYYYNVSFHQYHQQQQQQKKCIALITARYFSQEMKQTSNKNNNEDTQSLSGSELHELRVAEAIAKAKELQKESQKKQQQKQMAQKQHQQLLQAKKEEKRQRTMRLHAIFNIIQHWASRDPTFFETTMNLLNMHNDDPSLQEVSQQNRVMYYDSIPSFRSLLNKKEESELPPNLLIAIDKLDKAGFGNSIWAKKFRRTMALKGQKELRLTKLAELNGQAKRLRKIVQDETDVLSKLKKRQQDAEIKRQKDLVQRLKKKQQQDDANEKRSTPLLNSVWDSVKNVLGMKPDTMPSLQDSDLQKPSQLEQIDDDDDDGNDDSTTTSTINASSSVQKRGINRRIDLKMKAVQQLGLNYQQVQDRIAQVQHEIQNLRFANTDLSFTAATQVLEQVRPIICQELANHIQNRHDELLKQFKSMDSKTDLTQPHEWYSYARLDKRKIIFHGGPTNSGKTYNALQRLKKAKKGLYLGPLRLLAGEVYENLTADGIFAQLFTGQERREIAFATHSSATVEMANPRDEYDVAVIDEIQMVGDERRGFAWTGALLGIRCKEIHVCGGLEAAKIVKKMADACGDDFEVVKYERFRPLQVENHSLANKPSRTGAYKSVQSGDCIIAFSRNDIFAIKREIEKNTNYKCCVIYGKLPPQVRIQQARLFNDPNSGYDILVASDAIGMGLNLNIRRIIFNSIFKFNGEDICRLAHTDIKQIGGRAGRRNSIYPDGLVTCRDPRDLPYIHKCMSTDISDIKKAGLLPTAVHIENFAVALHSYNTRKKNNEGPIDLYKILKQFSAMATVKGDYFLCRQTAMRKIAKRMIDYNLSIREAYTICLSPANDTSLKQIDSFASKVSSNEVPGLSSREVPKRAKTFDELSTLCNLYGSVDLFLWLQQKFPPSNAVEQQAAMARKETILQFINEALSESDTLELNHCYIKNDNRCRIAWQKSMKKKQFGYLDDDDDDNDSDDDNDEVVDVDDVLLSFQDYN